MTARFSQLFAAGQPPAITTVPLSTADTQATARAPREASEAPRKRPRRAKASILGSESAPADLGAGTPHRPEKAKKQEAESAGSSARSKLPRQQHNEVTAEEWEARTLFVGNVPLAWDKKKLRQALRAAAGKAYDGPFRPIWFRAEPLEKKWSGGMRKVGSILGAYATDACDAKHAYVVLATRKDVEKVRHTIHGLVADERHVLRADGVGPSAKLVNFDRKRSIFVGNLPGGTSESDLRTAFASAGDVDAVRVIRDRDTKACKGFAFVRFRERRSVKEALDLWGVEVQGRSARVMKVSEPAGEKTETKTAAGTMHPAARRIEMRSQARHRHKVAAPQPLRDRRDGVRRRKKPKST